MLIWILYFKYGIIMKKRRVNKLFFCVYFEYRINFKYKEIEIDKFWF